MLRDQARRHRPAGDAFLYLFGRPHPVTKETSDNKHKSTWTFPIKAWKESQRHAITCKMIRDVLVLWTGADSEETEAVNHLRAHVSYHRPSHQAQPKATGRCPGRPDIPL